MGTVIFDTSMSLDGFMTAANRTVEVPLGPGGEVLTQWAMDDRAGVALLGKWVENLGASIAGRVTYDTSLPWWGPNGPSGAARRPLFVVTHQPPDETLEGGVYAFVTDGIESALAQAQAAAGDKDVVVMGGADLGQQYLRAGLVDEMQIHLVPVVFGAGTRMFENVGRLDLETLEAVRTERATHVRFRLKHSRTVSREGAAITSRPLHRAAGTGATYLGPGDLYRFLVTGAETGGAYFAMEAIVPPGGGPPPHIHRHEDETFYIVEGKCGLLLGEEWITAGVGDFVNVPRGTVHRFKNQGTEPMRMIVTFTPAGIEKFFEETLERTLDPTAQIPDNVDAVAARYAAAAPRYGIEFLAE